MQFFLVPIILLLISTSKFEARSYELSIQAELRMINFPTCPPVSTCEENRISDSLDLYACQCGPFCNQLGTCCADSPNRLAAPPRIRQTCTEVFDTTHSSYYMANYCPANDNMDSSWKNLCEKDWDAEDDFMRYVPVTSLSTNITYKNYFCFRCHEATNEFLYWNSRLKDYFGYYKQLVVEGENISINYNKEKRNWMASLGNGSITFPVDLRFEIPQEIQPLYIKCGFMMDVVVSNCSKMWSDRAVSDKCEAYMGIVHIRRNDSFFKYRNVHCALCNFEVLANFVPCSAMGRGGCCFTFTHLLDINRKDGDKVGKVQKCKENFLWDPFSKTCKEYVCALPEYVLKNGKCTPP